jgi:hypothetical protein
MGLARSNAFPSLASNLVLGVPSRYEWNRPDKLQRCLWGVVSAMGCWARPETYP